MKPINIEESKVSSPPSDMLLKRDDLILVAAGSGTCLRELYYRALKYNKLHQLIMCRTTNDDYTFGTAEEKIIACIRQAAKIPGVQVIVLYLNCLDILIRLDFDYIEGLLSHETGVTVRCFFRGPLAKMDVGHYMNADEFMASLPQEKGNVEAVNYQLPLLATDISGVVDCFEDSTDVNVLVAPSGCRACLRDSDLSFAAKEQYYVEFKQDDYIFGLEDTCVQQCRSLVENKHYKSMNLISSAVGAFIGLDGVGIASDLESDYLKVRNFALDGFKDAVYGIDCAQKLLVEQETVYYCTPSKDVLILGYSSLACGSKKQYEACLDYIKKIGYRPRFLGILSASGRPSMCWIVSAAGIGAGQELYEKYGVPLLISCPVGEHAFKMWKKNVKELCENKSEERRQLCIHNYDLNEKDTRRLLFIGDPVQTMGLAHYMWHAGFQHVKLAVPCMDRESKVIYKQSPGADKFLNFIEDYSDLKALVESSDIVVADSKIISIAPTLCENKETIAFPWGIISGRTALADDGGALGTYILKKLQGIIC